MLLEELCKFEEIKDSLFDKQQSKSLKKSEKSKRDHFKNKMNSSIEVIKETDSEYIKTEPNQEIIEFEFKQSNTVDINNNDYISFPNTEDMNNKKISKE